MTDPFNVALNQGIQTKKVKPVNSQDIDRQLSQVKSDWSASDSAAEEAANSQYSIAQEDFNAEITSLSEEYNQEEISANEEYQAEVELADGEVSKAEQNYNEASKNYDSVVKSSDASVAKAQQNVSSLKSALSSLQSSSSSNVSYSTEKNMSTNEDLAREKMISDLTASVKKAESELQTTTQKAEEAKQKAADAKTKAQEDLESAKQNAEQAKAKAEDTKNARVQTALNKRTQGEQAANNVLDQAITQAAQTASEEKAKNEATFKPQVDTLEAQKQAQIEERKNDDVSKMLTAKQQALNINRDLAQDTIDGSSKGLYRTIVDGIGDYSEEGSEKVSNTYKSANKKLNDIINRYQQQGIEPTQEELDSLGIESKEFKAAVSKTKKDIDAPARYVKIGAEVTAGVVAGTACTVVSGGACAPVAAVGISAGISVLSDTVGDGKGSEDIMDIAGNAAFSAITTKGSSNSDEVVSGFGDAVKGSLNDAVKHDAPITIASNNTDRINLNLPPKLLQNIAESTMGTKKSWEPFEDFDGNKYHRVMTASGHDYYDENNNRITDRKKIVELTLLHASNVQSVSTEGVFYGNKSEFETPKGKVDITGTGKGQEYEYYFYKGRAYIKHPNNDKIAIPLDIIAPELKIGNYK